MTVKFLMQGCSFFNIPKNWKEFHVFKKSLDTWSSLKIFKNDLSSTYFKYRFCWFQLEIQVGQQLTVYKSVFITTTKYPPILFRIPKANFKISSLLIGNISVEIFSRSFLVFLIVSIVSHVQVIVQSIW